MPAYIIVPKKVGVVAVCVTCAYALSAHEETVAANDCFPVKVRAKPDGAHAHCELCQACLLPDDAPPTDVADIVIPDGQLPQ